MLGAAMATPSSGTDLVVEPSEHVDLRVGTGHRGGHQHGYVFTCALCGRSALFIKQRYTVRSRAQPV